MPGFYTDFANNRHNDAEFGGQTFTAPADVYIGLSRGAANKPGTVAEPTGVGSYARVQVPGDLAHWPASSGGAKSNATAIDFTAPTADQGTMNSVFAADAPTGGNVIAMSDITPRAVPNGGPAVTIAIGAFVIAST